MTTECTHKPVISPPEGVAMGAGACADIAAPIDARRIANRDGGSGGCVASILPPDRSAFKPTGADPTTPGVKASGGFLDGAEAITNAAIGLLVSLLLTWLWLGFTPMQSAGITAVFFAVSTARSFAIRRFFRWVS